MISCKPVTVTRGAFNFCKYSIALILWAGVLLRNKELVILSAVILALSAILTVGRAPMIILYTYTVEKLFPSHSEVLDEHAMRFAHILGTVLIAVGLLLLYLGNENPRLMSAGWGWLFVVAIAKTVGALGFCAASKLYTCVGSSGSCCAFIKGKPHE